MTMGAVIESGIDAGRRRRVVGHQVHRRPIPASPRGEVRNCMPYYSAVRFASTVSVNGLVYTYNIAQGTSRRAFGYALGDPLSAAGFPASYVAASPLETNLIQRAQTNSGESVLIRGISAYLTADSDPMLAALVLERMSVQIAMNGDQQVFRLGRATFLPGGGGLVGAGHSQLLRPGMNDQMSAFSVPTNGLPGRENYFALPDPIIWKSSGRADSNFVVLANIERPVNVNTISRAAATGVEAWNPPVQDAFGGYVDVVFRLHTTTSAPRSNNA